MKRAEIFTQLSRAQTEIRTMREILQRLAPEDNRCLDPVQKAACTVAVQYAIYARDRLLVVSHEFKNQIEVSPNSDCPPAKPEVPWPLKSEISSPRP